MKNLFGDKSQENSWLEKVRLGLFGRMSSMQYSTDFSREQITLFEQVKPFTMTSIERVISLVKAIEYVSTNNIEGAIVECGVWRGGSMMAVAQTLLQCADTSRHLYLFDTFEGMPKPSEEDKDLYGKSASKIISNQTKQPENSQWCYASLDEVEKNLALTGYPRNQIHFVQGKVEDTIPLETLESIALLRLDTDWYESTIHELKHLYPKLVHGGVLIVDDYGHWEGARKAVDEYWESLSFKPLLQRIDYTARLALKL
jgi:hypothetical protein